MNRQINRKMVLKVADKLGLFVVMTAEYAISLSWSEYELDVHRNWVHLLDGYDDCLATESYSENDPKDLERALRNLMEYTDELNS